MKRALALVFFLSAGLALADRTVSLTWSTSLSTVDAVGCSRGLPDAGWVASVRGTARLSSGVERDPDAFPDAGAYSATDTLEVGPVSQCGSNLSTMGGAWKQNRGL